MVRLFVGSFLQEDEAERIDQFAAANQEKIQALTKSDLRFVTAANLHITWVFLGEVPEEKVNGLKELLRREVEFLKTGTGIPEGVITLERSTKKYPPGGLGSKLNIDLVYDYIEAWPRVEEGRVLVATPTVVPDEVLRIGLALRKGLGGIGTVDAAEPRNYMFRPHLTLARFKPACNFGDGKILSAMGEVIPFTQKIEKIHLIKSELGGGAADYEILETVR